MEPFQRLDSVAVPVWRPNIDTDAIIAIADCVNRKRPDFGEALFRRWRSQREFSLNQARYQNPEILVGGLNFGCGSSREMAVWALCDYGIRCVIAPSFGEIFFSNCFQNGVLPIRLPEDVVAALVAELDDTDPPRLRVDLETCQLVTPGDRTMAFEVNALRCDALLRGLDPIEATLSHADRIEAFQREDRQRRPWIYTPGSA